MRKIIIFAFFAIYTMCAMTLSAQKYIDTYNTLWSFYGEYENTKADSFGLHVTIDSVTISIRPMPSGLIDLEIDNNCSTPIKVIWDESTLDSEGIVFGDMLKLQIGTPIKPSIVESKGYITKSITRESYARDNRMYVDPELDKNIIKDLKYSAYLMKLFLCIDKAGVQTRHKISLKGIRIGKNIKDSVKDAANETQDFTEIDAVFDKVMK